jgi:hypothetical protein
VEQMVGLERNAARSSAWQALHLTLTFSGLSVFKNNKTFPLLAPQQSFPIHYNLFFELRTISYINMAIARAYGCSFKSK